MSDGSDRTDPVTLPDLPPEWRVALTITRSLPDGAGEYVIAVSPSQTPERDGQYVVSARIGPRLPMLAYADTFAEAIKVADLADLTDRLDAHYLAEIEVAETRAAAVHQMFGDGWRRA